MRGAFYTAIFGLLLFLPSALAGMVTYRDENGTLYMVDSPDAVPAKYREKVKDLPRSGMLDLAKPSPTPVPQNSAQPMPAGPMATPATNGTPNGAPKMDLAEKQKLAEQECALATKAEWEALEESKLMLENQAQVSEADKVALREKQQSALNSKSRCIQQRISQ